MAHYPGAGGQYTLALCLADVANNEGQSIWPSVRTLAHNSRQSERTVQRQLRAMEASGWLICVSRNVGGKGQPNRYHINPDLQNARYVPSPEPVYSVTMAKNPEFNTDLLRLHYSSMITPNSVIDYHMDTGEWEVKKEDEIPSGYDKTQYESERIHAVAPDGLRVPISLVYKKGMTRDGSNPLLMYGYGAYGSTIDAAFNANRLSLLDRGFIFVIAHIRGGSDLGRAWYEWGRMFNKKNTFTDFIACARSAS